MKRSAKANAAAPAAGRKKPKAATKPAADAAALIAELEHPLKPLILDLRALIRETEPDLEEGVKWNALNYAAGGEDRITFMARSQDMVRVIFHCGAKPRKDAKIKDRIGEAGMLDWPSADRGVLTLKSREEFRAQKARIASIVRDWIAATA